MEPAPGASPELHPKHPPGRPPGPADVPRTVSSEALLGGGRELVILHGADRYRLRLTSQGKLILTK